MGSNNSKEKTIKGNGIVVKGGNAVQQVRNKNKKVAEEKTATKTMTIPMLGVSLRWFARFVAGDEKVGAIMRDEERANKYKVYDLVERVKEITKEKEESVGEMLQRTQTKLVKETADIFVSYTWGYLVRDMVASLETLMKNIPEGEDKFVWMDSLIMNQHKADRHEYDTEFWTKTFHSAINKIGNVAVIMTPWDNPQNLTRSWCLWELYGTTLNPDTKVEVVIVPSQRESFRQALHEDVLALVARIGKIDVTKAQAWNKKDQEMILDAAQKAKGGVAAVQESVVAPIRRWMTTESKALIEELEAKGDEVNREDLARMYNSVGLLLNQQGLFEQQEIFSRKAVSLFKELYGEDHQIVASSLANLAGLLRDQGKYGEAESLYREALTIHKNTLGEDNQVVAVDLGNLAGLFQYQSRYAEAEPLLRESLEIKKKALGEEHPSVAIGLANLAGLLKAQGKYGEAELLYLEALTISKKVLGEDHPNVAIAYANLARLYQDLEKFTEAEESIRNALRMDKKSYGESHPNVAIDTAQLASILKDMGKLDEADQMCEKALEIGKVVFPGVHPRTAYFKRVRAEIDFVTMRLEESERNARNSVEIYTMVYQTTPNHADTATSMLVLAKVLKAKNDDTAKAIGQQCLEMFERTLGPNHPKTVKARKELD